MEPAVVLLLPSSIIAILALALNFEVQVAMIRGQSNLKRKICQASGICWGFGILFLLIGMLAYFKLFTWTTPIPWLSVGSFLIISVAIPLLVQGARLGKTGNDLIKFANGLYTTYKSLIIIAVVALVIVIGIISFLFIKIFLI